VIHALSVFGLEIQLKTVRNMINVLNA
jgi:hypothetical protein